MDWIGSLGVQCETRMRWAQLKQRLWAQGKSSGSSKSSRQIGQVSSDSSVSIFRQNKGGSWAKSREADQLSVKMTQKWITVEDDDRYEKSSTVGGGKHVLSSRAETIIWLIDGSIGGKLIRNYHNDRIPFTLFFRQKKHQPDYQNVPLFNCEDFQVYFILCDVCIECLWIFMHILCLLSSTYDNKNNYSSLSWIALDFHCKLNMKTWI